MHTPANVHTHPHTCTQASPSELALRDAGAQLEDVRVLLAALSSRADVLVERASGKADATAALGRALQACASHDDVSGTSKAFSCARLCFNGVGKGTWLALQGCASHYGVSEASLVFTWTRLCFNGADPYFVGVGKAIKLALLCIRAGCVSMEWAKAFNWRSKDVPPKWRPKPFNA
eukprot:1139640-Pelagomonas_calceolata.AAC.1